MPRVAPDDWTTWLAPQALLDIVDGVAVIAGYRIASVRSWTGTLYSADCFYADGIVALAVI